MLLDCDSLLVRYLIEHMGIFKAFIKSCTHACIVSSSFQRCVAAPAAMSNPPLHLLVIADHGHIDVQTSQHHVHCEGLENVSRVKSGS